MTAALNVLAAAMLAALDDGFLTTVYANRTNCETSEAEHADPVAADWLAYADGVKSEIPAC